MQPDLPVLRCGKRPLGPVAADQSVVPWPDLQAVALSETVSGNAPLQATWFKAAWDDHELRVLFYAADTHIWATHTQRDAPLYEEEVLEVFLDPIGDLEAYFELEVNPLNTVLDLVLRRSRNGHQKNFGWQCEGLRTAVKLHPEGKAAWCAEFSIPFAALGSIPPPRRWRANFYRIDRPEGKPRELSAWSPTLAGTFHVPARFGIVELVG